MRNVQDVDACITFNASSLMLVYGKQQTKSTHLPGLKDGQKRSKRKVQTEEAMQYAMDSGIIFIETSAKTNVNVKELFVEIAKKLPLEPVASQEKEAFPIVQSNRPVKGSGKSNCC